MHPPLVLAVSGLMPSHLVSGTARLPDILLFTALQGVGTGYKCLGMLIEKHEELFFMR